MLRSYFIYVAVFISVLMYSCTSHEEKKQSLDGDKAYSEFKDFVATTEEYAESEEDIDITDTTAWVDEIIALKNQYAHFNTRIDQHADHYTSHQREVLMDLKDRFSIALDRKQKKFDEAKKRYKLRQEILGVEVTSDELTEVTPANIKSTYQNFVNTVSQEKNTYTDYEWEIVDSVWSALNARKQELQDQLRPVDTVAISKRQHQYLNINKKSQ